MLYLMVFLVAAPQATVASPADALTCTACHVAGGIALGLAKSAGKLLTKEIAGGLCQFIPRPRHTCTGFIGVWIETIRYILENVDKHNTTIVDICGMYMEQCYDTGLHLDVKFNLTDPPSSEEQERREIHYPGSIIPGLKVVHIADLHLDVKYAPGYSNQCRDPICCRYENGYGESTSKQAGVWGDYNCDAPKKLIISMIDNIKERHPDVEYIMWTGDNAPHDVWQITREEVLFTFTWIRDLLKEKLPSVQLVPVLGNHDSAPANFFPPPELKAAGFEVGSMYNSIRNILNEVLPPASIYAFSRGGFYKFEVRKGLHLIVLNTNVAYRFNLWVLLTARKDPYGQLQWLVKQLHSVRRRGHKCHIVGHVSPSDPDIIHSWSHAYHQIIYRFSDVVTAQFFSHTHLDEVDVSKDDHNLPFAVTYVAPSLTPWLNVNPGYRVYTIDGARDNHNTWEVIDVVRFTLDLQEANDSPGSPAKWLQHDSTADMYRLLSLSPQSWLELTTEMSTHDILFKRYYKNLSGGSKAYGTECDSECREKVISDMIMTRPEKSLH